MRLRNIDILRGIVMVLMCIDHARDYTLFHPTDPMVLSETPFAVYILRILAHFCAPVFIVLAGISARLSAKKRTKSELSIFLFTRGLVLCALEITLVNWAWSFNPAYKMIYLQVIWAIGISMIALSLLIYLRDKYILILSVVVIAGHDLFNHVRFEEGSTMFYIWSLLLQKNVLPITDFLSVRTTYPVLPVIAIMALGYVLGRLYPDKESVARKQILLRSGISMLVLFFVLRLCVGYGDPHAFEFYPHHWPQTLMSVFNVTKYPLSFQFVLMTLGVAFIFLSLTDQRMNSHRNPFTLLGQTPMFFYILHIYILHSITLAIVVSNGISPDFVNNLGGIPPDFGFPLIWLAWIIPLTILILIPLCRKYQSVKQSKKYKWTSYI